MKALKECFEIGLCNRDGKVMVGKDFDDMCYLIAEADTYHNKEMFIGLGSTEQIKISDRAFDALVKDGCGMKDCGTLLGLCVQRILCKDRTKIMIGEKTIATFPADIEGNARASAFEEGMLMAERIIRGVE